MVTITVAQTTFEDAIHLSQSGTYYEADLAFSTLMNHSDIDDQDIALARAYNYSWWGKTEKAKQLFQSIIDAERNPDALLGMGYTLHFNNEDAAAIPLFNEVIDMDRNNISAWKGLFHSARQLDRTGAAFRAINQLLVMEPANADFHYAKGQLSYGNQRYGRARLALAHAVSLDPKHMDSQRLLKQLTRHNPRLEIGILGGVSDAEGKSRLGLRRIEAFYRNHRKNLIFAFYDNALSFENLELVQLSKSTSQVGLGNSYSWNKYFNSTLTLASRSITGGDENMIRIDQNIYPIATMRIQAGLSYHDLSNDSQTMVYSLGLEQRLSEIFSLEVQYFNTQNSTIDQSSHRYIISPKIRLSAKIFLNASGYFTIQDQEGTKSNGAQGLLTQLQFPLARQISGRFLFHYQREDHANIQSAALGVNCAF
jgi:tetratricopeptide (TPR) repeat protein